MSRWNKNKNKAKDVMKANTVWGKRQNHKEVHLRLRLIGRARDCFLMLFSLLKSGRHLPLTVLCGHQPHMPTVQACPSSPVKLSSTQLCWSSKGGFQSVLPLALGTDLLSVTYSAAWFQDTTTKAIFTFSRLLVLLTHVCLLKWRQDSAHH